MMKSTLTEELVDVDIDNGAVDAPVLVQMGGVWLPASGSCREGADTYECVILNSEKALELSLVGLKCHVPAARVKEVAGPQEQTAETSWGKSALNCGYLVGMAVPTALSWCLDYIPPLFTSAEAVEEEVRQKIREMQQATGAQKSVYVTGAGFNVAYYFGIFNYLKDAGLQKDNTYFAISAGNFAVVACHLFTGEQRDLLLEKAQELAKAETGCGLMGTLEWLREFLLEHVPENAYEKMRGKHVVITGLFPGKIKLLSDFQSNEDYIDAVICSCAIPGFVWRPLKYKGEFLYDYGPQSHIHQLDHLFDHCFRINWLRGDPPANVLMPSRKMETGFTPKTAEYNRELATLGYTEAKEFFEAKKKENAL